MIPATERQRKNITREIIERANLISKDINGYNIRVLIFFLKDELNRNYDEYNSLKKEKFKIQMMLGKLKKEIFKDIILLDVDELNKRF